MRPVCCVLFFSDRINKIDRIFSALATFDFKEEKQKLCHRVVEEGKILTQGRDTLKFIL